MYKADPRSGKTHIDIASWVRRDCPLVEKHLNFESYDVKKLCLLKSRDFTL